MSDERVPGSGFGVAGGRSHEVRDPASTCAHAEPGTPHPEPSRGPLARMRRWTLWPMLWKEFVQMRRDRLTLAMMLGIPILQLVLFGFAIRTEVRHLPTVVLDESRTSESRALVAAMEQTQSFRIAGDVGSREALRVAIERGDARAAIVVPPDFARDVKRGRTATAQVIVDAADPLASSAAISGASLGGMVRAQQMARERGVPAGALAPVDVRVRPWYNPALRSAVYIVPGIVGLLLSLTLLLIMSMAIVRERERGTLEQLQVTPATRLELILGKIAPYIVIGYFQFTLTILLMRYLFDIEIVGSILQLYLVGFLFMAAVLGLGMLISTIAQTQMQATQMSMFFLLPFVFLSGYVFPVAGMPVFFQWVSNFIPAKYFIEIIRGIVLRGASLAELWRPTALLAVYTLLIITAAVMRFKKTSA